MEAISYTRASHNLAETMDKVCRERLPVVITREGQQSVVMLLLEFDSLEETAYLLRSPANAKRLLEAKEALERADVAY
jgi:antitoxin YefM